jgi:hypothetical protein
MRPSGVTGRRVFIQDSSRPATGFVPAYSTDRDVSKKPEKEFNDFFEKTFSEEKLAGPIGFQRGMSRLPIYKGTAAEESSTPGSVLDPAPSSISEIKS